MNRARTHRPELLAPAGSEEALHAAVENGADAVYFGIAGPATFNARQRAQNIALEALPATMRRLHRLGVSGYVTLNTLAFPEELPMVETLLLKIANARVDAILVQDLGVARLARSLCPDLVLHASTQMSLTSAEAFAYARKLGIRRVVLPRELSVEQIAALARSGDMELEAFVHGALCISFSGQCYASLSLGGLEMHESHSANRGRCAQPCRMPYTLIDAESGEAITPVPRQCLSPTDLAALPLLLKLRDAGVAALKIEGRLKPPEYVAEVTRVYRNAIDTLPETDRMPDWKTNEQELERLALIFSRGFSTGWLEGVDPHRLVPGDVTAHRGVALGTVIEGRRDAAVVELCAPVRRGDGVLFENKECPERSQGGRVYEIIARRESIPEAEAGRRVLLTFANNSIDSEYLREGQSVRKTDDPRRERQIRQTLQSSHFRRRVPLRLFVRAVVGEPLALSGTTTTGAFCRLTLDAPLEEARKHPMTKETLQEQLGRLGETVFFLETLETEMTGNPMIPLSVLGQVRRRMIEQLETSGPDAAIEPVRFGDGLKALRRDDQAFFERRADLSQDGAASPGTPVFHVLFRDVRRFRETAMLRGCLDRGCRDFYAELTSLDDYKAAAESVRKLGAAFVAVLPRMLKPGELKFHKKIAELNPDAVLVRNLGSLAFFRERGVPCLADFSFNIVNDLAARQLLEWGAERLTLGWDLNSERFEAIIGHFPVSRVELIVVGRTPLFTMEHCLWKAHFTEPGRFCGRICRTKGLKLKDRRGVLHAVRSDMTCRNIIENGTPLEFPKHLPSWIKAGVRHLRIEWDDRLGTAGPEELIDRFSER